MSGWSFPIAKTSGHWCLSGAECCNILEASMSMSSKNSGNCKTDHCHYHKGHIVTVWSRTKCHWPQQDGDKSLPLQEPDANSAVATVVNDLENGQAPNIAMV